MSRVFEFSSLSGRGKCLFISTPFDKFSTVLLGGLDCGVRGREVTSWETRISKSSYLPMERDVEKTTSQGPQSGNPDNEKKSIECLSKNLKKDSHL